MAQRVDTLPQDMRARVRSYIADRQAESRMIGKEKSSATSADQAGGGRKITVPIMDDVSNIGDNEKVSAAILAKVLEERAKERSARHKFCIDVGTQTHGWHFPDNKIGGSGAQNSATGGTTESSPSSSTSSSSPEEQRVVKSTKRPTTNRQRASRNSSESTAEVIQILRSISMDSSGTTGTGIALGPDVTSGAGAKAVLAATDILLASVIRTPPASHLDKSASYSSSIDTINTTSESGSHNAMAIAGSECNVLETEGSTDAVRTGQRSSEGAGAVTLMTRSATYSAIQTDI
jgi:hypothetical protein